MNQLIRKFKNFRIFRQYLVDTKKSKYDLVELILILTLIFNESYSLDFDSLNSAFEFIHWGDLC